MLRKPGVVLPTTTINISNFDFDFDYDYFWFSWNVFGKSPSTSKGLQVHELDRSPFCQGVVCDAM